MLTNKKSSCAAHVLEHYHLVQAVSTAHAVETLIRAPAATDASVWLGPPGTRHVPLRRPTHPRPPPSAAAAPPLWFLRHADEGVARTTVSRLPAGLQHLDNTIETDRSSCVVLQCVGGTKIAWWLFLCVETKEPPRSALLAETITWNRALKRSRRDSLNS